MPSFAGFDREKRLCGSDNLSGKLNPSDWTGLVGACLRLAFVATLEEIGDAIGDEIGGYGESSSLEFGNRPFSRISSVATEREIIGRNNLG